MELAQALDFIKDRKDGVLSTQKRDGRPQLSNITYGLGDDGVIRISVTAGRVKAKNLARDPRASLHVTSDDFYAYAAVECDVELTPAAQSIDNPPSMSWSISIESFAAVTTTGTNTVEAW